jgi:hypothetical protein
LDANGTHEVRAATIWLAPDPHPALPEPVAKAMKAAGERGAIKSSWVNLAPTGVRRPPARARDDAAQARLCAALDARNAQLNANVVALEGKVKILQAAVGIKPPVAAAPAPKALPKAGAPAAVAHAPAKDSKAKKEKASAIPWLWIGGITLAALLVALVIYVVMRKTSGQAKPRDPAAKKPGLLARLLRRKEPPAEAAPAQEPAAQVPPA